MVRAMHLTMDDSHITTVEQLSEITSGLQSVELKFNNKQEMYTWMEKKLTVFRYHSRKVTRKAQGAVLGYLIKRKYWITGHDMPHPV